jgi:fatty acid-binding protein DegV
LAEMEKDGPDIKTAVAHVSSMDHGYDLLERIKELYPNLHPEISSVGPVIGSHIGPGTVGIGWYPLTPELKNIVNF